MKAFTTVSALVAVLDMVNVDTDMIIPKQFLTTLKRSGLGKCLFYELRYDDAGQPVGSFVLNRPPFDRAGILITGRNFGCGSSREHAVWALQDFGIRAIIAESFADIFFANCGKNGILPVTLAPDAINALAGLPQPLRMDISLPDQRLTAGGLTMEFEVDPAQKNALLNGIDDIEATLRKKAQISNFEKNYFRRFPWLIPASADNA